MSGGQDMLRARAARALYQRDRLREVGLDRGSPKGAYADGMCDGLIQALALTGAGVEDADERSAEVIERQLRTHPEYAPGAGDRR